MSETTLDIYTLNEQSKPEVIKKWLENCPPWREQTDDQGKAIAECDRSIEEFPFKRESRGSTYVLNSTEENRLAEKINFALWLRRPLLVKGDPGVGKTSLAYHLAWSLGLGEPLRWEINSRSTLREGLYHYDAVGHFGQSEAEKSTIDIGEYITLGPLGTSFLPTAQPRVLIIDELDKADFDLPNDLLHIFEEGSFKIPELVRSKSAQRVVPCDAQNSEDRVTLSEGEVRTKHHPVVVITSNQEREFSSAFLRRCVQIELGYPTVDQLQSLVALHLGIGLDESLKRACEILAKKQTATDAVINSIYLMHQCGLSLEDVTSSYDR